MTDLAVVDAKVVTPDGVVRGGVALSGGRIVALLGPGEDAGAARVIHARGRYLLPGVVDGHVHFRTPGLTHKEDWEHGSRAAAAGGVTTVVDMPNTDPPLLDLDGGAQRAGLVAGRSLVDFGFHPGVAESTVAQLSTQAARATATVKAFLTGHHTAPTVMRDSAAVEELFARAAAAGVRVLLHAEDDAVFRLLDAAGASRSTFESHRPRSGAIVAIARVIELVRRHGTAIHVLHVSSAEEIDLLASAAAGGLPITFELTAHHLTFTSQDVEQAGSHLWMSPAIREAADRDRMWRAVLDGEVATIGSDHAPHTRDEKAREGLLAPPGIPGVQELLAAFHTGLAARMPDADERAVTVARLLAAAPADLYGLSLRKGRIRAGGDADLVVFDPAARWTFETGAVRARCGWSAYAGRTFTGRADVTIRRGEVIWDAASGRFGTPAGRYVPADRAVPSCRAA